ILCTLVPLHGVLRQIRTVARPPPTGASGNLVHSFVTTRLYHCLSHRCRLSKMRQDPIGTATPGRRLCRPTRYVVGQGANGGPRHVACYMPEFGYSTNEKRCRAYTPGVQKVRQNKGSC